jgi:hypothetical protein
MMKKYTVKTNIEVEVFALSQEDAEETVMDGLNEFYCSLSALNDALESDPAMESPE